MLMPRTSNAAVSNSHVHLGEILQEILFHMSSVPCLCLAMSFPSEPGQELLQFPGEECQQMAANI